MRFCCCSAIWNHENAAWAQVARIADAVGGRDAAPLRGVAVFLERDEIEPVAFLDGAHSLAPESPGGRVLWEIFAVLHLLEGDLRRRADGRAVGEKERECDGEARHHGLERPRFAPRELHLRRPALLVLLLFFQLLVDV